MILNTYQHLPEYINPIAFNIGPIEVSWYGLMYLAGFAAVYFLVRYRIQKKETDISLEAVQEFFPRAILGLLLGARLGDVIIYDWAYFKNHLSQIFLPFDIHNHWQYIGIYGMSFFGGLVGLAIVFIIFVKIKNKITCHCEERSDEAIPIDPNNTGLLRCARNDKKKKIGFLELSDLFAPAIPPALAFGRLGNFVNGELWGRATTVPWGMYFPLDTTARLRHPSQLYELLLEGILLFVILWSIKNSPFIKEGPRGTLTALFLIGYGAARFAAEFFREPDNGWVFAHLTVGQWMSVGIIVLGIFLITKNRIFRPV